MEETMMNVEVENNDEILDDVESEETESSSLPAMLVGLAIGGAVAGTAAVLVPKAWNGAKKLASGAKQKMASVKARVVAENRDESDYVTEDISED